ncbi:MAG: hypothetical protein Q9211_001803 [Gyalolechia sp. 1 TL-2023]
MEYPHSKSPSPATQKIPQPGLGTLSKLPLEIRKAIWEYFTPEHVHTDGIRGSYPANGPCCTSEYTPPFSPGTRFTLAILRASKDLHDEINQELYRNRVLTVCMNDQDHWHQNIDSRFMMTFTNCWITTDEICCPGILEHLDFSRFGALRLNVRLSFTDDGYEPFEILKGNIRCFADALSEHQKEVGASRMTVDVGMDTCSSDPEYWDAGEEVCLKDIAEILIDLGAIPNVTSEVLKWDLRCDMDRNGLRKSFDMLSKKMGMKEHGYRKLLT